MDGRDDQKVATKGCRKSVRLCNNFTKAVQFKNSVAVLRTNPPAAPPECRWRGSAAVSSSSQKNPELHHFHVCIHCGSAFRREEYDGQALISGVYLCPKCGMEGPLNVVIREDDAGSDHN